MPLSSQLGFLPGPKIVGTVLPGQELIHRQLPFRMKAGIESGPVALYVLRFFKSLCTPFQSTLISTMLGVELVPLSGMLVRSSSVNIENIGS